MDRYYLPEIFTHTMDGLDLKSHTVATYYMKDRLGVALQFHPYHMKFDD